MSRACVRVSMIIASCSSCAQVELRKDPKAFKARVLKLVEKSKRELPPGFEMPKVNTCPHVYAECALPFPFLFYFFLLFFLLLAARVCTICCCVALYMLLLLEAALFRLLSEYARAGKAASEDHGELRAAAVRRRHRRRQHQRRRFGMRVRCVLCLYVLCVRVCAVCMFCVCACAVFMFCVCVVCCLRVLCVFLSSLMWCVSLKTHAHFLFFSFFFWLLLFFNDDHLVRVHYFSVLCTCWAVWC